jgi:hypothetical protein
MTFLCDIAKINKLKVSTIEYRFGKNTLKMVGEVPQPPKNSSEFVKKKQTNDPKKFQVLFFLEHDLTE